MKKKILAVVLGLTLCFGMTGCTATNAGSKNYDEHSKLIAIEGENDLYYYSTTHVIYIVFNETEYQMLVFNVKSHPHCEANDESVASILHLQKKQQNLQK